ncbi:MAG: hypothetical protein QG622_240 [Actinomycetota bacterium]|nr:hypothetical protein [Actinomycetota bacterium]
MEDCLSVARIGCIAVPARIDLVAAERVSASVDRLLAVAPGEGSVVPVRRWLRAVERLLPVAGEYDRQRLLSARAGILPLAVPSDGSSAESVAPGEPDRRGEMPVTDAVLAAEIYEQLGEPLAAATNYAAAADTAAGEGRVAVALDTAVRALVALGGAVRERPDAERDLTAEAHLAVRLGGLCRQLIDYPRALHFYELALEALHAQTEHDSCVPGALTATAELLLAQAVELDWEDPERARLLDRAERAAHRLSTGPGSDLFHRLHGPRLLADVLCARGRPARAWSLLPGVLRAAADLDAAPSVRGAVHLSVGRCLAELGSDDAVADLDRAVALLEAGTPGTPPSAELFTALRLRSLARQRAGDVQGALDDARRLADLLWARHRRHVPAFMEQVWSRAGAEEERRDLEERTEALMASAEQDPLTGLANRRALTRFCGDLLPGGEVSLVLIDVDHFKAVNDRFGHGVGDAVLKALADLLTRSVRTLDVVARWGGEEFLIALPGGTGRMGADAAARVCCRVRAHPWRDLAEGLEVTVSAGVASGPVAELDVVLDRADAALYAAKHDGRNRSVVW